LKNKVYETKSQDLEDLRHRIIDGISPISISETCRNC